ncbi:polysaccharide deacetylase family protein [Jidongwangia harbinensis]|uniref:polysaccharide deacetylase family protein n=1 Tax=Jidongwangia harbinensis TaxID=2878561 RepID=UPI001CD9B0A8|nr:polysaccharide deacetylase family protein [Jidongwangia harbinensis]MCA2214054.1 polysaccharide deacetylase family protein [Jidongwangia harbinensis]
MRLRSIVAAVATAAAATLTVAVAVTPSASAAACNGYVALTYDDGPKAGTVDQLLNALRSAGARATFFNQGNQVQQNPNGVRAQQNAGMWIGNHSWSHPHMTNLSQQQMASEISQTQNAIQQITGTAPRLFRPPYGESNATLRSVQSQYGLTEVMWSVDSRDWNGASTAQIVQAASQAQDGGVILMHDGYQSTIQAVPQIVSNLANRNLCPGMISPSTGRAVAPDGGNPGGPTTPPPGGPTTPPPGNPGGSCTATLSAGQSWNDRFNLNVAVSGASNWVVSLALNGSQSVQNSWNASVTGTSGTVTVRPNGNGNNFGITIMSNGNTTWPAVSCRAG